MILDFIAIDPGKRIGWAGVYRGVIIDCGTVGDLMLLPQALIAVVEEPRNYPFNRSGKKMNPQIIVQLAMLAQKIADRYPEHAFYEPRDWRGNLSESRLNRRIARALRASELRLVIQKRPSVHAWDAIGIALKALDRL